MIYTFTISSFSIKIMYEIDCLVVFLYCIQSYLQSMFFNGKMNAVDGVAQTWQKKEITINVVIWMVLIIVITVMCLKFKYKEKIMQYGAYYIIAIQTVALMFTIFAQESISEKNKQLVVNDMFEVSQKDNVIVFLLDAYD